jgi:hypothetical protein
MSHLDSKVKGSATIGRGNVFGNVPVGPDGDVLIADAASASGVKFEAPASLAGLGVGLGGLWLYGDGADGNVTLVADTTLVAGEVTKNYNNLTLAGFTLTCDIADIYMVLSVKNTLAGGGGTISVQNRSDTGAGSPPGIGGTAGGTSGAGGDGGRGAGSIYVFAKIIGGVTLEARGTDGVDGTDGTVVGFVAGSGTTGTPPLIETPKFLTRTFPAVLPTHQGNSDGTAGTESAISATDLALLTRTRKDILRWILLSGFANYGGGNADMRISYSAGSSGGGGGNAASGTTTVNGGGGAGGGLGIIGKGGAGGSAFALATGSGNKASGGGGGAGAGGGLIHLICDQVTSATSLLADGGDGGNGGDGARAGAGVATGGGGGGGGGGGLVVAIVTVGSGFVTTSVTAGAAGVGGTSAGSGTPGGSGSPGGVGYAMTLLKT